MTAPATLTLTRPDDWHLHVRDGAVLPLLMRHAAAQFGRAIIMPNLRPPVTTVAQAQAYRERILLAFESISVAGSVGAYQYWARAASPAVVDVHVANDTDAHGNPVGGTVAVTLLTKAGAPSAELITQVQAALSGEKRRPLCDTVIVRAPEVLEYALDAELTLFTGANAVEVKAAAEAAWAAWESDKRAKLGGDIVPLDVAGCLKVAGVYNVRLTTPTLTVVKPR